MNLEDRISIIEKESIMIDTSSNCNTGLHKHPFFEFVYVLKGHAIHLYEDKTILLKPGDFFLINYDQLHAYNSCSNSENFLIVNCMFKADFLDPVLNNTTNFKDVLRNFLTVFDWTDPEKAPATDVYHDSNGQVGNLVRTLREEYRTQNPGYRHVMRNTLITCLIYLMRNEKPLALDSTHSLTSKIKTYVAQHYNEPLTLSIICPDANYSLSQISKIFKKQVGITFQEYVKSVRVAKACYLLKTTKKSVAEIMNMVGYSDSTYFYRIFQQQTQMTPQNYRNSFK